MYVYTCVYTKGEDGWNKGEMKGRGENGGGGGGKRGNEIQKASTRCKWQSIYIPLADFGAGGV